MLDHGRQVVAVAERVGVAMRVAIVGIVQFDAVAVTYMDIPWATTDSVVARRVVAEDVVDELSNRVDRATLLVGWRPLVNLFRQPGEVAQRLNRDAFGEGRARVAKEEVEFH